MQEKRESIPTAVFKITEYVNRKPKLMPEDFLRSPSFIEDVGSNYHQQLRLHFRCFFFEAPIVHHLVIRFRSYSDAALWQPLGYHLGRRGIAPWWTATFEGKPLGSDTL